MSKSNAVSILSKGGKGRKDRNAAIAAEVFETLANTHGNSAQAASLHAILDRALVRYTERAARKALKAGASESAVVETIERPAAKTRKPRGKAASKARTTEPSEDAAVAADAPREADFVARMRALAADAEQAGERV